MRLASRRRELLITVYLVSLGVSGAVLAEEYSLDMQRFEKKAFEFRGYAELEPTYILSNQDGALYQLEFFDQEQREQIVRLPGALELEGRYRKGITTLSFRTHSSKVWDYRDESADHKLYEGLLSLQPDPGFILDVGKKAYRWGTGYAWNPVAFVERAKDAGDPDLAREGYWILGFDWIRSFDGPLQTVAFTPLLLPNQGELNEDFGEPGYTNFAAKLYLLYRDIDIDLLILTEGSRSARYGVDFANNFTPNFELHGEFAYITDVPSRSITPACTLGPQQVQDVTSYLLGTRYRNEANATFIFEYYFNGAGNYESDQRQFYDCVHQAWEAGDSSLLDGLPLDDDLDKGPFSKPNPMRRYLNFRTWWNEPYGMLYFVPGLQVLYNVDDHSYSVSPEASYSFIEDLEMRLRATIPMGDPLTEWGEKPNDYKIELRLRYYF